MSNYYLNVSSRRELESLFSAEPTAGDFYLPHLAEYSYFILQV